MTACPCCHVLEFNIQIKFVSNKTMCKVQKKAYVRSAISVIVLCQEPYDNCCRRPLRTPIQVTVTQKFQYYESYDSSPSWKASSVIHRLGRRTDDAELHLTLPDGVYCQCQFVSRGSFPMWYRAFLQCSPISYSVYSHWHARTLQLINDTPLIVFRYCRKLD